ncbi:hypothetical protein [Spirosoma sp. KUDC1026]|uniref:hypothetical protein n=1 Tax=Spirosoma sp. KUDC1026 TaxID=2745947 RepID=UPI00159BD4BE|nr:hypothetical protein [Spirosoma sp. KUDC1026]QKZ13158.1 hypothetical protein HU175_11140 [Spirosoma sp. KUDC1026]
MGQLTKRLRAYFAQQPQPVRLLASIILPALLFGIALSVALTLTYTDVASGQPITHFSYSEPFDFSQTGFVWFIFLITVGFVEYCIWQPTKE